MKYRWLTNVMNCLFTDPTTIITQALQLIIVELKVWCKLQSEIYKWFGRCTANLYWVIDLLFDITLNLPEATRCMYMADITRCYKSIPLIGADNLLEALKFVIQLAFEQHHTHYCKEKVIWVHIKEAIGKVDLARWGSKCLGTSFWIPLSQEWLLTFQHWLIPVVTHV